MLVLCAYLGAMAGITALCYVFRKHPDEVGEGGQRLLNVDEDVETKPHPSATGVPDILVTSPAGEKNKTRGRSPLTPETQAKIQEVLDFVNTPSEQLVLETEGKKKSVATPQTPPLELPVYDSSKMKKPKEVIDDLKQSKAKVEAWISELDKVINDDGSESTTERHEKRTRGPGSPSGSRAIKPNMLAVNAEARKNAHNERMAKVKEEMAKRRTVLSTKADTAAAAKRREEEEKPAARKKCPLTPESGSGGSNKREVVEGHKRANETNNAAAAARKRPSAAGSTKGSSVRSENTAEDQKPPPSNKSSTSREEREAAVKASKGRASPVRRAPARQESAATEDKEHSPVRARASRQEADKTEAAQKAKTQTKPVSSFEVRMKYVPPGRHPRTPSPPHAADAKTRAQHATSKIPVLVNSRVRPPVVRPARVPREPKPPSPVVQKPKKSIRITHDPPLPSRRAECVETPATPPPEPVVVAVAARRSSSHHTRGEGARERSRTGVVQDDVMVRRASYTREVVIARSKDDANVGLPELNIIDVRGSRSCTPARDVDVHAELHSTAREVDARIAKSGPIRLHKNNSFKRDRSLSIANLRAQRSTSNHGRATVLPGQPVSVSKTVQLPEGTEDNVTVYFSVTMPRRGKSDVNWNEHDDSDHTITIEDDVNTTESVTEFETAPVEEELENVGRETQTVETMTMEEDCHSDDGVFPDELSNFPDGSDNEIEVDSQSSISGYDAREFDSCDEQF